MAPSQPTIAELFEMSISLERQIQAVYLHWQMLFASAPKAASFWQEYAREEDFHAKLLLNLSEQLTAEQLAKPADTSIHECAQRTQQLVGSLNKNVKTLDEALELATRIEHSEVNSILEFLVIHFSAKESTKAMVQSQLREHIGKLNVLTPALIFGENYKMIKAVN
ncbi:MAG: hypothetical protein AB1846_17055 [Chloroflexota bacterium]